MRSSAKRRVGRPRSKHRPVLAARVEEHFLARLQGSARKHRRNVSEELMWLAELGLNLNEALEDASAIREKAYSEANAILAAAQRLAKEEAKIAATEELLERAATRALQKHKEAQS
jgi:hypothetical protein